MGNNQTSLRKLPQASSDSSIQLIVDPNKLSYYAGENMQVNIHLFVRRPCNYNMLKLKFDAQERTHIYIGLKELVDKRQRIYYNNQFVVASLGQRLNIGYYRFPCTFQVHPDLAGTINHNEQLPKVPSLNYRLQASLESTQPGIFGVYSEPIPIFVMERCRTRSEPIMGQQTKSSSYGAVTLKMKASKNSVMAGETIVVSIMVDNTRSREAVKYARMKLVSLLYQFKIPGDRGKQYQRTQLIYQKTSGVPAGGVQEFPMALTIPPGSISSSIGHLTAFYYVVECSLKIAGIDKDNQPKIMAHIFVEGMPRVFPHTPFQKPMGMQPIVANKYVQQLPNQPPPIPREQLASHYGIYNKRSSTGSSLSLQNSYQSSSGSMGMMGPPAYRQHSFSYS